MITLLIEYFDIIYIKKLINLEVCYDPYG